MKKIVPILTVLFCFCMKASCLPKLSSFPSATATIFLDFDGHYVQSSSWNGGTPIDCAPSGLTDAQIVEIFDRVSEDFRPFNIDITTDSTVFLAAPLTQRVRIIITTTSGWYTGVGGVSYTGSFTWGDDTPGFVFSDRLGPFNTKMVAECCTHESGHTVGLSHQAKYDSSCNLLAVYNMGAGSGETGWAPIMGNSYYENFSGWYNGPTPWGCSQPQDALYIITTQNGFTYRADDHSDDPATNPTTIAINNNSFTDSGIITTSSDKDVFKLSLTQTGEVKLNVDPFSVGANNEGADLDVKVELLDSSFHHVQFYDPEDILNISVDTVLVQGTYYLIVQGAGNDYTSNYGSLGSYNISGTFNAFSLLATQSAILTGKSDNGKNSFSWTVTSPEAISSINLEVSVNGKDFTPLAKLNADVQEYDYTATTSGILFYRMEAISITDRAIYSNVIALKISNAKPIFSLAGTTIQNDIIVNALENYSYIIIDMSGRKIKAGKGASGNNFINMNNTPKGIYLVNISNSHQKLTERILKL